MIYVFCFFSIIFAMHVLIKVLIVPLSDFVTIYIDEMNTGLVAIELTVFEENYALLCNTVTDIIDPLIRFFVEEEPFSEKEILAITAAPEKLRLLLQNISISLKINNTRTFHMLLKIMKEHGGKGTRVLADHMKKRLKLLYDKPSSIYSDDVCIKNDSMKGLLVIKFLMLYVDVHSYCMYN